MCLPVMHLKLILELNMVLFWDFFLLYTNDLLLSTGLFNVIKYADITTIFQRLLGFYLMDIFAYNLESYH